MIDGIHRVEYSPAEGLGRLGVPPRLARAVGRLLGGRGTLASLMAVLPGEAGGGRVEVVPPTSGGLHGDPIPHGRVVYRAGDGAAPATLLRYYPAADRRMVGLGRGDVAAAVVPRRRAL